MADSSAYEADLGQLADLDDDRLRSLEEELVAAFDEADQAGDEATLTALADALDQVREEIAKRSEAPAAEPIGAAAVAVEDTDLDDEDVVKRARAIVEAVEKREAAKAKSALKTVEAIAKVVADKTGESEVEVKPTVEDENASEPATDNPAAEPETDAPEASTEVVVDEAVAPESVEEIVAEVVDGGEPVAETEVQEDTDEVKEGSTVATASGTVAVPRENAPVVASASSTVVAGANIPGFTTGQVLQSGEEFGQLMANRINSLMRLNGGDGEQVIVASIRSEAPKDRTLDFSDPEGNQAKIEAITDMDAITAGGGCCAPLTTRYDLFDCGGSADRPVRDALVGFRADRGGIRFFEGPALADLNGGVGFWTCADDALITQPGGNVEANWKKCARIECPPEQTAEVQAVTLCLTFGVLQSRIFPELAVANNKLAMVAHARIAESALLAQIKSGSVPVTDGGTPWGAIRDLLDALGRAAMYIRDRYRINGAALRAIFPAWVKEALRADISASSTYGGDLKSHFSVSDAEIEGFFRDRGINVTWALDGPDPATNGGGFFPAMTGSAAVEADPGSTAGENGSTSTEPAIPGTPAVNATLVTWPTTVEWALFVEGSWLYLDGGTLDLGIVRDASLVRTNDYQQFSEVFESAVHIGCESWWVTSTISVSGLAACCA